MAGTTIGLVAAMPDEIRPLLRLVGKSTREKRGGFTLYRFSVGGRDAALIQSGIGMERAAQAAGILIGAVHPVVVLNFGFAGAIHSGLTVGDLVIANRLLFFRERLFSEQQGLAADLSAEVAALIAGGGTGIDSRIHRGTFVTTGEIVGKQRLAGLLPDGAANPVVEMETVAVARKAARAGIPLVAIRAISDGAEEELDFSIEEFTGRDGNISTGKAILTLIRRPRILPQLIRLARNSRIAGGNLAIALVALLENLPAASSNPLQ
jgi:adenosylhomocysteine nucleosidase